MCAIKLIRLISPPVLNQQKLVSQRSTCSNEIDKKIHSTPSGLIRPTGSHLNHVPLMSGKLHTIKGSLLRWRAEQLARARPLNAADAACTAAFSILRVWIYINTHNRSLS